MVNGSLVSVVTANDPLARLVRCAITNVTTFPGVKLDDVQIDTSAGVFIGRDDASRLASRHITKLRAPVGGKSAENAQRFDTRESSTTMGLPRRSEYPNQR